MYGNLNSTFANALLIAAVEEKYGRNPAPTRKNTHKLTTDEDNDHNTDSSSESEDEDDDGVLASEALDAQIDATLKAIRTKDPRVYDENSTFYTDLGEEELGDTASSKSKGKPMYLSDYHRQNLLAVADDVDGDQEQSATYAQQQDDLRSTILQEMHATVYSSQNKGAGRPSGDAGSDSGEDFLIRKPSKPEQLPQKAPPKGIELNVEAADRDPDKYLSNFMAARAWLPSAGSQFKPFESDDEEEDQRAEAFEEAYNMRFENPASANEKLMSHARDAAAKYSVRKDTTNSRKKARDAERAKKELEKQEREEEKARLRKLQVAEMEDKVRKIKKAAGLRGTVLKEQDWSSLLDEGWDDARWEEEMKKRFGDEYYAGHETEDELDKGEHRRRKLRKPKWEDDIDINDLVPDFEAAEAVLKPQFDLSDHNDSGSTFAVEDDAPEEPRGNPQGVRKLKKNKTADVKREREEQDQQKKEARRERRLVEKMVDDKLNAEDTIAGVGGKKSGHFRYRETSPSAFGLTAHDILMASDGQLNQYAGLKKMAAFRDPEKKKRDKKRLGKKARLREWRRETFGSEEGPQKTVAEVLSKKDGAEQASLEANVDQLTGVREGKKRRKRSKKAAKADVKT